MTKILLSKKKYNSVTERSHLLSDSGLSNSSHLTAPMFGRVTVKSFQNGEGQLIISEKHNTVRTKKTGKQGRPTGAIIQSGLTRRGRKTIRIISDCYNIQMEEKRLNSCRFHTLGYRNIIPDDRTAKRHLDSYFKRMSRKIDRPIDYVWVAERQKRGVIHFHVLTPELLSDNDSRIGRVEENVWINKAWNEINLNWALKSGQITKEQGIQWRSELTKATNYYRALDRYKHFERKTKPDRPAKSTYLLLPNCIRVLRAGRYMTKYMSKDGQKIIGGMYGASTKSREYLEPRILISKSVENVAYGNSIADYLVKRAKDEGVFVGTHTIEHNGCKTVWCSDVYKLAEWYYEFCEICKTRHPLKFG